MSVMSLPAATRSKPTAAPVDLIRAEIDALDGQLLELIERRQRLAADIGALKPTTTLKLNPAREAQVISRLAGTAAPEAASLVEPVWRELMGAGLSLQQKVEIAVWPSDRGDLGRLARARFGGQANYASANTWEKALEAAASGSAVAVLALDTEKAWWAELLNLPDLWIFEAIGGRGPLDPIALAVGKIEPQTLARGAVYRISQGGDSEPRGAPERLLKVDHGLRLVVARDLGERELSRELGVVGATAL